jgi:hypothetical protein
MKLIGLKKNNISIASYLLVMLLLPVEAEEANVDGTTSSSSATRLRGFQSGRLLKQEGSAVVGSCGGGNQGNGVCASGKCCSEYGWCGDTPAHCYNGCGWGHPGDGICSNGMCCSQWGWCGQSAAHCGGNAADSSPLTESPTTSPTDSPTTSPTDNPTASPTDNPTTSPTDSPTASPVESSIGGSYSISSPARTLTMADIQAGLDKFNELQDWSASIDQSLVDNINSITSDYTLYRQLALVAQTMWESVGYQFTEETAAVNPPYATRADYQDCDWTTPGVQLPANGKFFYGRGYIQLSWCANYILYGQDRLVDNDPLYFYKNPELVATTPYYAFDSAAWFFETQVVVSEDSSTADDDGQFGLITKAINGDIECSANYNGDAPEKRYAIFEALSQQVGLTGYNDNGC